jgi:uncharacterized protein (UPF0332 family)
MESPERQILIEYRIEQAKKMVDVSELLIKNNEAESAINRIYYGMFYMLLALGLKYEFETSKHQQLLGWFNKKFIHTGQIDKKYGRMIRKAYDKRMRSDYEVIVDIEIEEAEALLSDLQEFILEIESFLNQ